MNMIFTEHKSVRLRERYYLGRHESGLEVVIIPKKQRTLYATLATKYGSRDNTFKTSPDADFITVPDGIAHFLEHKLFENEDGSDTFSRFAALGASANAYTSNDMTAYLFSATDNYYESLAVLCDFVTHPYFTEATVAKEMGIIEQELKMYEDNPHRWLYQELVENLYHNNTVRINVGGTVESIRQITHETLYSCYNTFYSLNNMVLIISGDAEPVRVEEVLDRTLTRVDRTYIEKKQFSEPPSPFRKHSEKAFPIARPIFAIGLKEVYLSGDGDGFIKREAEHVLLNEIMFSKTSALYNRLYDKGLINSKFGASYQSAKEWSHLVISGESDEYEAVFDAIYNEIRNFREGSVKITPDAFERAHRVLYADNVQGWNTTSDIAEAFLDYYMAGADMLRIPEVIEKITLRDLEERLHLSYDPEMLATSVATSCEEV